MTENAHIVEKQAKFWRHFCAGKDDASTRIHRHVISARERFRKEPKKRYLRIIVAVKFVK